MTTAKFEDNFWGEGNRGFDILLHNFKTQTTASKELAEYIKERALVEDGYVKSLSKLHKVVAGVPEVHFGAFVPMWKLVKDTSEQLSSIHAQFFKMLTEVSREITEYNIAQKEKQKTSMRGEIENANDSLITFNTLVGQVHRTKKQYQQGVEHVAKAQEKLSKALADPTIHAKTKQHLESKVKQAQTWMETMKADHQAAVRRQCEQLMEFQGKMKEACGKFESLEEEHLAQMSTFMLKLARSQNSTLVNIEQHYAAFNSHLDDLSVEKLLLEFVQAKGTGTEKPTPYKFRPIDIDVPPISLSTSSEDVRSVSPSHAPGAKNTSRGEKGIKSRFKKKKQKTVANGPIEEHPQQPENAPEVDEEGYSIRPADAASISQFPDQPLSSKNNSDSDSDFDDDEPESRIKTIKIKDTAEHPQATVDDIKASVMSLRLGATSPGIKKATSTHSLNAIATPPANRKDSSNSGKNQTADDSKSVSSLLDLDDIIIGPPATSAGGGGGGLPPPLMPSLFNLDPMATLTPLSVQSSTSSSSILTPTPALSTTAASTSSNSLLLDPGMGTENPPSPRPIPRPRNSSTLKANSQEQKDPFSAFEEAKDKPTDLPAPSAGGIIPPLPNKKRKSTGVVPSTSSQSISSTTSATGGVAKSSSGYSIVSITSEKSFDSVTTPFETNFVTPSQDDTHLSTKSAQQQAEGNGAVMSGGSLSAGSSPKMTPKFPKDGGASPSLKPPEHSDSSTLKGGILPPPQAAPRRGSGGSSSRRRSANPQLGPSGSSGGDLLQTSSPLTTARVATSRSTSTSPINFNNKTIQSGVATTNGVTSTSTSSTASPQTTASNSPTHAAIPIAVAVQETCNAIFKGNDMNKCVIKVNGEVMVSFPASYVSQLASHDVLTFRVANADNVERLLHNQHLLKKEGDGYLYKFDMSALVANLKQMKEKQNSPYCNIQILKYEVKASSGGQLPLKLISFWKCEPTTTNFRLDYIYQPSSLKQLKKPAMTNMSVVVPVSGGVRKSMSKPEGSWVAEQNRIMWKLGDLQPTEEGRGTLHAKFDVTSGPTVPAPATIQFLCDGATMSGLTFELTSDAYRVSLTKNKCLSGKYTAEIVHHY